MHAASLPVYLPAVSGWLLLIIGLSLCLVGLVLLALAGPTGAVIALSPPADLTDSMPFRWGGPIA